MINWTRIKYCDTTRRNLWQTVNTKRILTSERLRSTRPQDASQAIWRWLSLSRVLGDVRRYRTGNSKRYKRNPEPHERSSRHPMLTFRDILDYSQFAFFCWVIAGVFAYEYTAPRFRQLLFRVHNVVSCLLLTLVLASMQSPLTRQSTLPYCVCSW